MKNLDFLKTKNPYQLYEYIMAHIKEETTMELEEILLNDVCIAYKYMINILRRPWYKMVYLLDDNKLFKILYKEYDRLFLEMDTSMLNMEGMYVINDVTKYLTLKEINNLLNQYDDDDIKYYVDLTNEVITIKVPDYIITNKLRVSND